MRWEYVFRIVIKKRNYTRIFNRWLKGNFKDYLIKDMPSKKRSTRIMGTLSRIKGTHEERFRQQNWIETTHKKYRSN